MVEAKTGQKVSKKYFLNMVITCTQIVTKMILLWIIPNNIA